jgi:hypothetical protein
MEEVTARERRLRFVFASGWPSQVCKWLWDARSRRFFGENRRLVNLQH